MEPLPIAIIGATESAMLSLQELVMKGWRGSVTVWHDGEILEHLDSVQEQILFETVLGAGTTVVHRRWQPNAVTRTRGDVVIDGAVYARILR